MISYRQEIKSNVISREGPWANLRLLCIDAT